MELKFDFAQSATRAAIVEQLKAALGDAAWEAAAAQAESARFDQDHYHHIGDVNEAIDALDVPARVKDDMHGVYAILAQAEATVHECEVEHTHFHEVGNASALRNALLICLAIAALDPERITATPVQTGSGKVKCAHGLMDIPAPATAAILATGIPVCADKLEGELCTPTSAAMIKHFVQEFE